MSRTRRLLAALLALAGLGAGLAGPARAAHDAVGVARADEAARISATALAGLAAEQRADGLWDDATGRVVGASGLPTIAWAALHAEGEGAEARRTLARRSLARGSGATVILRWPLAMLAADDPAGLPADLRTELRGRVASWGTLQAAGIADRCYRRPDCFNNYKLVDAVLNLELARSGIRGGARGTRLAEPDRLRGRTEAWLDAVLPVQAPPSATVRVPGRPAERAALLTDPGAMPLAYHSMCTAWAVRAVRLLGPGASLRLRAATRRALWALVGLAAPNGEVAWSGRGQDQLWTLTAAMYAAAAGSAAFADTDPVLAARLRRLVDVELAATAGRLRDGALQVLPSGNDQLTGLDHYYSAVGSTGLALTFLEMARDELPDPAAPRLALPAEVPGATFADPGRSGVVARRVGGSWIGVRLRRDHHFDPRQDFGLVRALRLRPGGWQEQRPARPRPVSRPGRTAQRVPSAGPLLVLGGQPLWPRATGWRPLASGVELTGRWRSRTGRTVPARWRITASAAGAALQVPCPRGAGLQLTEWLPRRGTVVRGARSASRAGYRLSASAPLALRPLTTRYANARQPSLAAARVAVACRGGWVILRWTGGARAAG
jgi:hypothetical protein